MKRNTLMKRMAIAALVATMSVGMAVPAFAAPGSADTSSSNGQASVMTLENQTDDDDLTNKSFYYVRKSTFKYDYKLNLDTLKSDDHDHGTVITGQETINNKTGYESNIGTVSKDTISTGTIKPSIDYAVEYVGDEDPNADVKIDGTQVKVTPKKWGTTFFKISETFHYFAKVDKSGKNILDGSDVYGSTTKKNRAWDIDKGYTGSSDALLGMMKHYADGFKATDGNYYKAYTTTYTWYVAYDTPFDTTTLDEVINKADGHIAKASTKAGVVANIQSTVKALIKSYDPKSTNFSNQKISDVNKEVNVDNVTVTNPDIDDDDKVTANITVGPKEEEGVADYLDKEYTFKYGDDADLPYDDVTTSNYYYDQVKEALEDGAFTADSDTHFGASDTVTRADFVYAMWKKEGAPQTDFNSLFTDIGGLDKDHQMAISWAVQNHIASGYGDTSFKPDKVLNRAAVVQFLYAQSKKNVASDESKFSDVTSKNWFASAVKWASGENKVAGYKDGTFRPFQNVTKAQAAAFLYR